MRLLGEMIGGGGRNCVGEAAPKGPQRALRVDTVA